MFVDIHTHILPGIDDGAKNWSVSVEMIVHAAVSGTRHIIATPHWISGDLEQSPDEIQSLCNQLQMLMNEQEIGLTIYPGCEVFISNDLPQLFDSGKLYALNQSRYMLIDLPLMALPAYTRDILFQLELRGLVPVLAHPERNQELRDHPEVLKEFLESGVKVQCNSGSLTGLFGKTVQKAAYTLIEQGLVHFVASDAHSTGGRNTDLNPAAKLVESRFGKKAVSLLFEENPSRLMQSAPMELIEPYESGGKSSFWINLFGKKR